MGEAKGGDRGQWGNQIEFLLACVGYAVGLGNVWRFPYLCYENGGGAFLIPYTVCLILAGLPIFYLELAIGQFSSLGPNVLYNKLCPIFTGVGWAMIVVAFTTSIYYNMIIAWVMYYFALSIYSIGSGTLMWDTCNGTWNTFRCQSNRMDDVCVKANASLPYWFNGSCLATTAARQSLLDNKLARSPAEEFYNNMMYKVYNSTGDVAGFSQLGGLQWEIVLCLALSWLVVFACLIKGVQSTGKVVYFTATFPYFVLVILMIRGVTLDGATDGIYYYLNPKPEFLFKVDTWRAAATQIFYSLGPAFGSLLTMASYNPFKNNCYRDALIVAFTNCGTSVFAGFAIFSTLGFMAKEQGVEVSEVVQSGPGLAFIAYPEAIVRMPYPPIWAILFFFMLFTLGLDSQFAMVEAVTTAFLDQFTSLRKRKWAVIGCASIVMFILGLPMCTGGGIYIFTIFDYYCATYALLLVGLVEIVVVVWVYGINNFCADIEMMLGTNCCPPIGLLIGPTGWYWKIMWMFVAPVLLSFIFIMSFVNYSRTTYGTYTFPIGAELCGWLLAAWPILTMPFFAIAVVIYNKGFAGVFSPKADWAPAHERERRQNGIEIGNIPISGGVYKTYPSNAPIPPPAVDNSHANPAYNTKF